MRPDADRSLNVTTFASTVAAHRSVVTSGLATQRMLATSCHITSFASGLSTQISIYPQLPLPVMEKSEPYAYVYIYIRLFSVRHKDR